MQDIVKELARTASLAGSSDPAPERQSSGGVAFTAGEVKKCEGCSRLADKHLALFLDLAEECAKDTLPECPPFDGFWR